MPNTYFTFKQFTIHQAHSAMKVCTDSCLLGSILPLHNTTLDPVINVLDIGTGTGLLSLQYAQRNTACSIIALEIEKNAAAEATKNVRNSPYAHAIKVQEQDYITYKPTVLFDLIICNPPFYNNELKSSSTIKNIAHHSTMLTVEQILSLASTQLAPNGIITLLLPHKRLQGVMLLIHQLHLHVHTNYTIHQDERMLPFRTIVHLTKTHVATVTSHTILIKQNQEYSQAFTALLSPYYMHM